MAIAALGFYGCVRELLVAGRSACGVAVVGARRRRCSRLRRSGASVKEVTLVALLPPLAVFAVSRGVAVRGPARGVVAARDPRRLRDRRARVGGRGARRRARWSRRRLARGRRRGAVAAGACCAIPAWATVRRNAHEVTAGAPTQEGDLGKLLAAARRPAGRGAVAGGGLPLPARPALAGRGAGAARARARGGRARGRGAARALAAARAGGGDGRRGDPGRHRGRRRGSTRRSSRRRRPCCSRRRSRARWRGGPPGPWRSCWRSGRSRRRGWSPATSTSRRATSSRSCARSGSSWRARARRSSSTTRATRRATSSGRREDEGISDLRYNQIPSRVGRGLPELRDGGDRRRGPVRAVLAIRSWCGGRRRWAAGRRAGS